MKKIYTMLTAALFGVASLSAAQLTVKKSTSGVTLDKVANISMNRVSSQAAVNPGPSLRPAPPTTTTVNVAGEYVLSGEMDGEAFSNNFKIEQNGTALTIKGFIFSDADDIQASLSTINYGGTIYDTVVIPGDGATTLFTQQGNKFGLYLYGPYAEEEGSFIFPNDLIYIVAEDGLFDYYSLLKEGGGSVTSLKTRMVNCTAVR